MAGSDGLARCRQVRVQAVAELPGCVLVSSVSADWVTGLVPTIPTGTPRGDTRAAGQANMSTATVMSRGSATAPTTSRRRAGGYLGRPIMRAP